MQTTRPWLARLAAPLLAAALLTATATAQEGADPYAECGAALAQLDVEAFRRATHDGKPGRFIEPILKPALHGKICDSPQLEAFFRSAGWWIFNHTEYKRAIKYSDYSFDESYIIAYGPNIIGYILGRSRTYSIHISIKDKLIVDLTWGPHK
jgi:hypothetical protein